MGMKHDDIFGAWCCSTCHDAIDHRIPTGFSHDELKIYHYEGIFRTQEILKKEGLI